MGSIGRKPGRENAKERVILGRGFHLYLNLAQLQTAGMIGHHSAKRMIQQLMTIAETEDRQAGRNRTPHQI